MRRFITGLALIIASASPAGAHVTVRPRESVAGAVETYTVRVPTEGQAATTHVDLDIPPDLTVVEVPPAAGVVIETSVEGGRITRITWRKEVPPKASAEFVFRARNPAAGTLIWKARQHLADGATEYWTGTPDGRRPAARTTIAARP